MQKTLIIDIHAESFKKGYEEGKQEIYNEAWEVGYSLGKRRAVLNHMLSKIRFGFIIGCVVTILFFNLR